MLDRKPTANTVSIVHGLPSRLRAPPMNPSGSRRSARTKFSIFRPMGFSFPVDEAVWIVTSTGVGDGISLRPTGAKVAIAPGGSPEIANVTGNG